MQTIMNVTRHIFITAFFFLLGFSHLAAQDPTATVSGTIRDDAGAPVPYANVVLLDAATGELVIGTVSEEGGGFLLSAPALRELTLSISSIGLESFRSEAFRLDPGTKKDFGSLRLGSELAGLDEVTVRAARPNVVIQADKTVVTVEGTVLAEGNTALDVIGRSPGVFVDADGNIQLNGRTGLIVLIDDRQTYMSAADLANFLRAMPADNIRSIEVIQNPPAKYDAEGAAGVINLVLKKNTINGTHGNLHAGSQFNGLHTPSAGATLNVKKDKWTSNVGLNYNQWGRFTDLEILRRFQLENGLSAFDQEARLKLLRNNLFFSAGTEYQINDRHSLGVNVQASGQKGTEDGNSLTAITNPDNANLNYLNALNDSESDNTRTFGNLHYTGKLDTLGTKISADIDYTHMDAGSLSLLSNQYWQNENSSAGSSDRIRTANEMDYTIFTAKVDFTKPLGAKKELETGLKGSWVRSDNLLDISKSEEEGPFAPDPNSNRFIYRENVLAAYASYKMPLSEKLRFQAGLRAEYAAIEGHSVTRSEINTQEYLDLFPSAYLQHQVSEDYQIVYNLNRRITRPYYRQLNPFVFYIDPLTTEEGNPKLRPQYANNLEMNHILKNAYQFSLSFSQTENAFGQIMVQDEETRKTSIQMQNLDRIQHLSLRAVVPVEFAEWYSTSNMLQLNGNTFQSQLGEELLDEKQFSFMVRSQHNLLLPKGFKLEMVGMYRSPFRDGQLVIQGMSWVDAGITKTFYEDKLSLTLNGSDIFRTMKFKGNIDFDRIDTDVKQYNSMQSIRFTLRWKFSQGEQFNVSQRSGSTEERNRLE